jgi:hypothetical protein
LGAALGAEFAPASTSFCDSNLGTSTLHASPAQSGNVAVVLQYVPGVSARLPSIDRPALTAVECSGPGGQSRACDLQAADDTPGWCGAIGQTDSRRPHGQSFIPLRLGIPTLSVLAELSFPC